MHKDVRVAELDIDDSNGMVTKVGRIFDVSRMPAGTVQNGIEDGNALKRWWSSRSIPASRDGIAEVLCRLDIWSTAALMERCMGLSLSDHY